MTVKIPLKQRIIYVVLTISIILVADFLVSVLNKYIMKLQNTINLHLLTVVGIASTLALFYFIVKYIKRFSDWFVHKFVHINRVYLGRNIGLVISIVILYGSLYAGYYWVWFNKNLFKEIFIFFYNLII